MANEITKEQHPPPYVVAIPSYDQTNVMQRRTLPLLLGDEVPTEEVYVFADPTQHEQEMVCDLQR